MSEGKKTERATMAQITVKKSALIEAITANKAQHKETLDKALEAYKAKAIALLEEYIEDIREGAVETVFVSLPRPENHFADYDRALEIFKHEVHDEYTLSAQEFDMYFRDNWQWKAGFTTTNSLYNVTS